MPKRKPRRAARAIPLVVVAPQRVAPARLPINPAAGAAGRYQMPQLVCLGSGRGKNTRAVLDNLGDVAAALERPADYITHYIQYAASIKASKEKGGSGGKGATSLRIDPSRLEELLQCFIEEWVLCLACGLPESEEDQIRRTMALVGF